MTTRLLRYANRSFELAYSLAKANFKLRNEGSYFGTFWYLLNPLAMFVVILFVRQYAFKDSGVSLYPMYLLVGLLMFNFFTQTIGAAFAIIEDNSSFIKSIKIPLEAIVLARVLQSVFSHFFEMAILAVCMVYWHIGIEALLVYVVVFAVFAVFVLGASLLAAVIGAHIRDIRNVWVVLSQILFFITPIFYAPINGSLLARLNEFNPLFYFLESGRSMFVYGKIPGIALTVSMLILATVSLVVGIYVFHKNKMKFAELV